MVHEDAKVGRGRRRNDCESGAGISPGRTWTWMLTLLATACYVRTQQQWDPTLGFPGEGGTTDMAHAMGDKCGAHSATFLLQRALCLFLAYFLRARAAKHVATLQRSVLDAMFQKSVASARREPGPEQQSQITPPSDMEECAIRSPCRKEAAVVTRWAALFDMLPRAQRALMDSCVSRPGSLERGMIDVRTVDGKCATRCSGRHRWRLQVSRARKATQIQGPCML